jgi:hypothetical protein
MLFALNNLFPIRPVRPGTPSDGVVLSRWALYVPPVRAVLISQTQAEAHSKRTTIQCCCARLQMILHLCARSSHFCCCCRSIEFGDWCSLHFQSLFSEESAAGPVVSATSIVHYRLVA